jgi:hydroxymethylglutaryl-CoA lyase/(R)-citramalyl-CoA lyase
LLREVGPRDGLQNEEQVVPPETRAELVDRLAAAGLRRIEVASFVNPERVPQMAGAEEVVEAVDRRDDVVLSGLALNERGYDRLRSTGLDEVSFAVGATESFSQRNAGASVEAAIDDAERIVGRARDDGIRASVTISVAFGCPFEGPVDSGRVLEIAEKLTATEPDELVLADTIGVATPRAVKALMERVGALGRPVGGHFHNTRNTGFANAYAALEAGASALDASVGGLGGCPFAPNATGNVATEDLVYLLEGEGVDTGVDLGALIAISQWLEELFGRRLEGYVYRAGPFRSRP